MKNYEYYKQKHVNYTEILTRCNLINDIIKKH